MNRGRLIIATPQKSDYVRVQPEKIKPLSLRHAGPHPKTAGDLFGPAGLPGASLHRPEEDGAAQLRGRIRLAALGRGADGRGPPLLQRFKPAHGQELAPLLLPLDDGRQEAISAR